MIAKTDTIDADELLIERIKAGDMAAYNVNGNPPLRPNFLSKSFNGTTTA